MQPQNLPRPNNLSMKELAHYGLQSDDPWVKTLAGIVDQFSYYIPKECLNDPDDWFQEYQNTIENCERDVRYAEEEFEYQSREMQETINKQEKQIKAMQYDLNAQMKREMEDGQVTTLKAQVMHLHADLAEREQEMKDSRKQYRQLQEKFEALQEEHKYLTEKHNTWTVIAKPEPHLA